MRARPWSTIRADTKASRQFAVCSQQKEKSLARFARFFLLMFVLEPEVNQEHPLAGAMFRGSQQILDRREPGILRHFGCDFFESDFLDGLDQYGAHPKRIDSADLNVRALPNPNG